MIRYLIKLLMMYSYYLEGQKRRKLYKCERNKYTAMIIDQMELAQIQINWTEVIARQNYVP